MYTCTYKRVDACAIQCDVYPGHAGAPVAVYIHGGALIFGARGELPAAAVAPFKKAGYWVVSIDYRLAPETKLPLIIEDVRDALDWVRGEGCIAFGYDADRLVVMGASAGGYLALMTGTFEIKPKALVSLYGYGDILGDWYRKPSAHYRKQPLVSAQEAQTTTDRTKIYLRTRQTGTWTDFVSGCDVSAERAEIEKYCPILNIDAAYPPTILLHGDRDTDVPYEQSLEMYNALKARGLRAELVTYAGGGHAFDWNPNDPNVPGMIEKAFAFVEMYV